MTTPDVPRTVAAEELGGFVPIDGPTEDLVRHLSARQAEPDWMLRQRLRARERLRSEGIPSWASFLRDVDLEGIVRVEEGPIPASSDAPDAALMAGSAALEASEEAYRQLRQDLMSRGVHFCGLRAALARMPDLVRTHFASVIASDDGPLSALIASLWTGGSFLYVPPHVTVDVPLQAEIREDYAGVEPFERNVIVADHGADVTYIEGCTAPVYTPDQLHISAIEVVAMPGSRVRYIALQNFSKEVDNLVTKRARVHEGATVEWVDVNLGSRRAWKIPRADLVGPDAAAEFVGVTLSGRGQ
ncbi:MAG: SufD family Fe-S cluster assembly protein, partial [Thermoplasmata archaeon]